MRNVRIRFSKTGAAKYISHLDLMRCFSRAMVRAEIPLWYTEGFNPHPYMNFAMPLSLGMEGMREVLDIRIVGDITNAELKERLSNAVPDHLEIIEVYDPVEKASRIAFSKYRIEIEQNDMPDEKFSELFLLESEKDEIILSKM